MKYLTAIEAARRLGVAERTVRLWIQSGKLSAHHAAKNRLAIPESEVEALVRERGQYQTTDTAALEQKITELEARIMVLEKQQRAETPVRPLTSVEITLSPSQQESAQNRTVTRNRAHKEELPEGCILARDFALQHGVSPATFRDHITIGIGRGEEKDKVAASERPKANRPGETERYLTSDQQQAALDYWTRHGVPHQ